MIGITLLLGTRDYMGAGAELIEKAVETGETGYLSFFWKMILTALTCVQASEEAKLFLLSA